LKPFETEYLIHQYYKVTVDDSTIDNAYEDYSARMHRMFDAIVANKETLQAVLEYRVIAEHVSNSGDDTVFFEAHYGREVSFSDILAAMSHIFTQEDRAWWLKLFNEHKELETKRKAGADLDAIGYFDLSVQVEDLENCFKVEASGWNISEHTHAHEHDQDGEASNTKNS
jgi:phenylalanine-4-hydroxylase